MNLNFIVTNQRLIEETEPFVVSDSIKFLSAKFDFSSAWQNAKKTAIFKSGEEIYSVILSEENSCVVPWETIKSPFFTVSVYGTLGNKRITTNPIAVRVVRSGYVEGETPKAPTPTVYEQIIDELGTLENSVNSLGTAAVCNTGTDVGNIPILNENGNLPVSTIPPEAFDAVKSDWNETDSTKLSYIENKPTALSTFTNDEGYVKSSELELKTGAEMVGYDKTGTVLTSDTVQSAVSELAGDIKQIGDVLESSLGAGKIGIADSGEYYDSITVEGALGEIGEAISAVSVKSNWNETDESKFSYIENKPTALSNFTDDLGTNPTHTHSQYLTQETDPVFEGSAAHSITAGDITNWNAKSEFSGSYTDLTDKPALTDLSGVLPIAQGGTGAKTTRDAQTNLQIYSSLGALNLSSGCTTHDIITALPDYSIFNFAVNNNTIITDIPSDWGQLTIIKSNYRKTILYNTSLTSGQNGNNFWFGEHNGSAVTWYKIFTANPSCFVPISNGGTGATTATAALTNLGAQAATDNTLNTTDKTIVGAINEIYSMVNSQ